jgi:hypothetical protein
MSKTRSTADILIVDVVERVATRLCDVGAIREPQMARAKVNVIACDARANQLSGEKLISQFNILRCGQYDRLRTSLLRFKEIENGQTILEAPYGQFLHQYLWYGHLCRSQNRYHILQPLSRCNSSINRRTNVEN